MTGASLMLTLAFVGERAHQWQTLAARGPVAAVVLTLVIGWGEGLGFHVQSERAFFGMVFWVMAAHVVLSGSLPLPRTPGAVRVMGPLLLLAATLAAMLRCGDLAEGRPAAWFGVSLLPVLDDDVARAVAAAAAAGSVFLAARARAPRACALLVAGCTAAACATWMRDGVVGSVTFLVFGHALPVLARNLAALPARRRVASALLACAAAGVEWFLVARSVWFPPGSRFPDRVDWWDLGPNANAFLLPVWMAPFLAHVLLDAWRGLALRDARR